MGPAGIAGLVGQPSGGLGDPGCLERGSKVGDLLDRLAAVRIVRHGVLRGSHQLISCSSTKPNARS
jgi:hypothetical protein